MSIAYHTAKYRFPWEKFQSWNLVLPLTILLSIELGYPIAYYLLEKVKQNEKVEPSATWHLHWDAKQIFHISKSPKKGLYGKQGGFKSAVVLDRERRKDYKELSS